MSKILGKMFFAASILYLLVGCVWGAIMTLPSVHEFVDAGPAGIIVGMHSHWNLLGWVSLAIMGAIYYLVPMMTKKELYSEKLGKIHFWLFNIFIIVATAIGVWAGYLGGTLYLAENFAAINPTIGPLMMAFTFIAFAEAGVNFIFAYNISRTIRG